jgi:AcrR family transcriptional regulator
MPRKSVPEQAQLVAARRNQILDAATRVFATKGFSHATIREIAREAGLADGTIYIYFPSKTDLLLGILDRLNESDQRDEHLAQGLSGDLKSFFAAYLAHRLAVMAPAHEMLRAVLPELLVNAELRELYYQRVLAPTMALAERHIAAMVDQGKLRPVDAGLAARAISGMALGLLVEQLLGDDYLTTHGSAVAAPLAELLFEGWYPDTTEPAGNR